MRACTLDHQPQSGNAIICHKEIIVYPFQELLNALNGGSPHRGGPMWSDWDNALYERHCRQGRPVDAIPISNNLIKNLGEYETGLWCGPICNHYGHQVADFSTRIAYYINAVKQRELDSAPFVFGRSPLEANQPIPEFFWQICHWFGIECSTIILIDRKPAVFRQLYTAPQGEQLFGPGPNKNYLKILRRHQRRCIVRSERTHIKHRLFVSRAGMQRGIFAGELALEEMLQSLGYRVLRPETVALDVQLKLYIDASQIIFSEGSAVHSLQLLGKCNAEIFVLQRRENEYIGSASIKPRVQFLEYVNVIGSILVASKPKGIRIWPHALTFLDHTKLFSFLEQITTLTTGQRTSFQKRLKEIEQNDLDLWLKRTYSCGLIVKKEDIDSFHSFLFQTDREPVSIPLE